MGPFMAHMDYAIRPRHGLHGLRNMDKIWPYDATGGCVGSSYVRGPVCGSQSFRCVVQFMVFSHFSV